MKMKYIVVEGTAKFETAIIFGETIQHKDVAGDLVVLGAGFIKLNVDDKGVIRSACYGESVSLGIKTRGVEDEYMCDFALNG